MKLSFIIIDDSELDCFVAAKLIRHSGISSDITIHTEALLALNDIREEHFAITSNLTVILLDLLMPVMSGTEFVMALKSLPHDVQERYIVIAITSSLNKLDIEAIGKFDRVIGIMDKPIKVDVLSDILNRNGIKWSPGD